MRKLFLTITMLALCLSLSAQNDKRDGRAGNRKYKKGENISPKYFLWY